MNAIPARATAQSHDQIARFRVARMAAVGQEAEATAEDQGIIDIAGMIEHRAMTVGMPILLP